MICSIEGCSGPKAKGRAGMCHSHYLKQWKHGDPLASPSNAPRNPNPARGRAHHFAKLDDDDARMIVLLNQEGLSTRVLAEKYEVSQSCIARLVSARNWKHI